jgi:hypothetical protein
MVAKSTPAAATILASHNYEASAKIYAAELAEFCATIRRSARNVF